ncbi:hypothetical protein Rmf_15260 [Roseomonas fluvialis]|uniref:YjiS-like domain-containing protein n=2 Tax=Roseomonas fluvialis TaxID=1750527 RepID=A0ABN6NYV0_9PROT|nr:hypothetical protein Rmf_15260 [Roseomonas fluvialis]
MWADTAPAWLMAMLGVADRRAPRRWPPPRLPMETPAERLARHATDRRRLARLDDRLLDDVGLTRDAVEAGIPFQDPLTQPRLTHQNWSRKP